jgi:pilus assembly protein CpaE
MMNIHPERTMLDLMPLVGEGELDTEMMHSYVAKHPSGVDVLITSVKPAALDGLSTDCLDNILYVLKRSYRYIVMDVPAMLQTITLHALAHSNIVFLIANLFDLTTASDTIKLADALEEDSIPRENINIVINRVSKSNQIQSKDIMRVFEGRVLAYVPNDSRLVTTINQGTPLALSGGDSPWKQSIEELADLAAGTQPSAVQETEDKPNPNLRWWRANGTA